MLSFYHPHGAWTGVSACGSMDRMNGTRRDLSRHGSAAIVVVTTMLLLAGCGAAAPGSASDVSATTPTAACPQVEGAELPPECAPYDPENAMAQNDRYRERIGISAEARAAAEKSIETVRPRLEALRTDGNISPDAVKAIMTEAGLRDVQLIGDERGVAFGVAAPAGGCVYGEVSPRELRIDAGGYIQDGGCLPAQ